MTRLTENRRVIVLFIVRVALYFFTASAISKSLCFILMMELVAFLMLSHWKGPRQLLCCIIGVKTLPIVWFACMNPGNCTHSRCSFNVQLHLWLFSLQMCMTGLVSAFEFHYFELSISGSHSAVIHCLLQ